LPSSLPFPYHFYPIFSTIIANHISGIYCPEDFSTAHFYELKSFVDSVKGDLLARAGEARAEEEKKAASMQGCRMSTPQKSQQNRTYRIQLWKQATKEIKFSPKHVP
jgi:hypothetical protein